MASELALGLLLQTLAEHHPETVADFRNRLGHLLLSNEIHSDGTRENLQQLHASLT
jgi:hypothetical protein